MKRNNRVIRRVRLMGAVLLLGGQDAALAGAMVQEPVVRMEPLIQETVTPQKGPDAGGGWQRVSIGGVVEVEAFRSEGGGSDAGAGAVNVATVEPTIEVVINDVTTARLVLSWEEGDGSDGGLAVDEATVTIANRAVSPFYFTAGRAVAPFGGFQTRMISDPLTLDLGETRETLILTGVEADGFHASIYAFKGGFDRAGDPVVNDGGVNLGFAREGRDGRFQIGAGYIRDLGNADGVAEVVTANLSGIVARREKIPAYTANILFGIGPFGMIGEYLAARKSFDAGNEMAFDGGGARPSAWNLEAGFAFRLSGREASIAVGYQETGQALGFGLPETRFSTAFTVAVMKNAGFSIEWRRDEDYGSSDSALVEGRIENGTGEKVEAVTARLAVEF